MFLLVVALLLLPCCGKDAACGCNWEDNWWLNLVEDLVQLYGDPDRPASQIYASDARTNISRSASTGWRLLVEAVQEQGLCRQDPAVLRTSGGIVWRFNLDWIEFAINSSRAAEANFLKELCLPGQVATDLLCSQFLTFEGKASAGSLLAAGRRVGRIRVLAPLLSDCLEASPWPLRPEDLDVYTHSWEVFQNKTWDWLKQQGEDRHHRQPLEDLPFLLPQLEFRGQAVLRRAKLPEDLRRCLPFRRQDQCWPRRAASLSQSCTRCCDPTYPRGQSSCFAGPWSFELCCVPDDIAAGWAPAPPKVEEIIGPDMQGGSWPMLQQLRDELQDGCPAGSPTPARPKKLIWEELKRWVKNARSMSGGQQRLFPELDLLVSTRACVGPEVEVPWFLLAGKDGSATSWEEIAAEAGAICGQGKLVNDELASKLGRRVLMPCKQPVPGGGWHKLEPYGLELMESCGLSEGFPGSSDCHCGTQDCRSLRTPGTNCCRGMHTGLEWRGLGILTGELRTNIAHFARDALWLHSLFRGNASLESLGVGRGGLEPELVLTKHAATECIENDYCVKTGRKAIFEMEEFLEEVALQGISPRPPTFDAGDPAQRGTVCFEVVAQRWRPWAASGNQVQSFRAKALRKCKIQDRGLNKKIVMIRRDSKSRQWKDEQTVKQHLKALAASIGSTLTSANLGQLTPCEQVEVLHDAMIMIGVHGADLTNMIFLPAGAAVVEVAVECEVEGGSIDTPFWRGPGTLMNGSVTEQARAMWRQQNREGTCPPSGATLPQDEWLQGYPTSQFAKLARQANLLYTAVMDCSGSECHRAQPNGGVFDRGWCSSDTKKRRFLEVDIAGKLIPTIWTVFDEYLRLRF